MFKVPQAAVPAAEMCWEIPEAGMICCAIDKQKVQREGDLQVLRVARRGLDTYAREALMCVLVMMPGHVLSTMDLAEGVDEETFMLVNEIYMHAGVASLRLREDARKLLLERTEDEVVRLSSGLLAEFLISMYKGIWQKALTN